MIRNEQDLVIILTAGWWMMATNLIADYGLKKIYETAGAFYVNMPLAMPRAVGRPLAAGWLKAECVARTA